MATDELEIGPARRDELPAVARLHHRWFGPGNELEVEGASLALLGARFLADAFYGANLDNPHFGVHVARCCGRIVAFNCFVSDRDRIGRHAILHHLPRLVWATLRAVAKHPAAVVHLIRNLQYVRGERAPWIEPRDAQWLVFTVEPEFRSKEYTERTGRRVAAEMFAAMEDELRRRGCPGWYGTVWVSNGPMTRFMERAGARVIGKARAQGHLVSYWRRAL